MCWRSINSQTSTNWSSDGMRKLDAHLFALRSLLAAPVPAEVKRTPHSPRAPAALDFCRLLVMQKYRLIEKYAKDAGVANLQVRWINIGGPAVMNDALLSGSADFIAAGPPAFLTLWDRTITSAKVERRRRHVVDADVSQHPLARL